MHELVRAELGRALLQRRQPGALRVILEEVRDGDVGAVAIGARARGRGGGGRWGGPFVDRGPVVGELGAASEDRVEAALDARVGEGGTGGVAPGLLLRGALGFDDAGAGGAQGEVEVAGEVDEAFGDRGPRGGGLVGGRGAGIGFRADFLEGRDTLSVTGEGLRSRRPSLWLWLGQSQSMRSRTSLGISNENLRRMMKVGCAGTGTYVDDLSLGSGAQSWAGTSGSAAIDCGRRPLMSREKGGAEFESLQTIAPVRLHRWRRETVEQKEPKCRYPVHRAGRPSGLILVAVFALFVRRCPLLSWTGRRKKYGGSFDRKRCCTGSPRSRRSESKPVEEGMCAVVTGPAQTSSVCACSRDYLFFPRLSRGEPVRTTC